MFYAIISWQPSTTRLQHAGTNEMAVQSQGAFSRLQSQITQQANERREA